MASKTVEMAVGTAYSPSMHSTYGNGVFQVVKGNTNVSLFGSLDGTNYVLLETFTASTIKEVVKCNYYKISGATGDQTTSVGTSKFFITASTGE